MQATGKERPKMSTSLTLLGLHSDLGLTSGIWFPDLGSLTVSCPSPRVSDQQQPWHMLIDWTPPELWQLVSDVDLLGFFFICVFDLVALNRIYFRDTVWASTRTQELFSSVSVALNMSFYLEMVTKNSHLLYSNSEKIYCLVFLKKML